MAGNTKNFAENWRKLTSDPFILDCIEHAHIDFVDNVPPVQPYMVRPYKMNNVEMRIVDEEIVKLLATGVIVECQQTPDQFVSNVFIRGKKDGSFRVILNLKELNEAVSYAKFKMETLDSIIKLMRKDCFMCSLDLTNAYYTIPVAEEHQAYLRFPMAR